jgi:hypothetical protein
MPSLHHTAASSSAWTAEMVQLRLVEAAITDRKMPGQRYTRTMAPSWPATPLHEFTDQLHWDNPGDGARERVWDNWEKAKGAQPIEVSRMEEAQDWLRWLPQDEMQCLDAWAKCDAFGFPVAKIRRKIGFSKSTFYRKVNDASQRIVSRLNREGVLVR